MNSPQPVALIRRTAFAALQQAETLLPQILPGGRRKGSEYVAKNAARQDRRLGSFGVSLITGRWNDFADASARGGDLVSLVAYLRGCRQIEAAQEIDQRLGLGLFGSGMPAAAATALAEAEATQQRLLAAERASRQQRAQAAAATARQLWQAARPADSKHPYLVAKAVQPFGVRQSADGRLVVPLLRAGALMNLQHINPDGSKRFLRGGQVRGCYALIGQIDASARLYLCEGWATGATLHQHTGAPVACAMNAGNLRPVALALRAAYGEALELVIAGDDDRRTHGNPGRAAANAAALAAGALVMFPQWPKDAPPALSDFNDLHVWTIESQQVAS